MTESEMREDLIKRVYEGAVAMVSHGETNQAERLISAFLALYEAKPQTNVVVNVGTVDYVGDVPTFKAALKDASRAL